MAFAPIAASDVDSDSPITDTLMNTIRTNFDDHETRIGTLEAPQHAAPTSGDDFLYYSNDTEIVVGGASANKFRDIRIPRGGTYRIKFDVKDTNTGAINSTCQIYKNGVAEGTLRDVSGQGGYLTFSEDISGWFAGDLMQLWGVDITVKNFRVYVDDPETIITIE